jgi:hypothetical protein
LENPGSFFWQHFIHCPGTPEERAFIVVGLNVSDDGTNLQVQLSGWTDSMDVDEMDMKGMLEESFLMVE